MDKIVEMLGNLRGKVPAGMPEGGAPPMPRGGKVAVMAMGGAAAVAYTAYSSLFDVEPGHRAVMFNRFGGVDGGKPGANQASAILNVGTHIAIPWFQRPLIFDIKNRPNTFSSKTGSKDLQMVDITIRVLTKPRVEKLPSIYKTLGLDKEQDARVLPSVVPEVLKAVVANYNAAQLVTQRDQISSMVKSKLTDEMRKYNMVLSDVSLTNISFGSEYSAAVERKQIAQQDAERAKFVVDKAEQTKKSRIIQATAEANSARKISEAMEGNPGYLELKRIERAREVAQTIARSPNRVYLNSENLLFNLGAEAMASNAEMLQKVEKA